MKKLCCSQDINDAIHKHQELSNAKRKDKIITKAFIFNKTEQTECLIRHVENINHYYNFNNDKNFNFKSRIISDSNCNILLKFNDRVKKIDNATDEILDEKRIEEEVLNITNLIKKNIQIKMNQRDKKRFLNNIDNEDNIIEIDKSLDFCKRKCERCNFETSIQMNDLRSEIKNFTLKMLNNELKNHGHAKYKKINQKNRNIEQAREELMNHFIKFHFKNNV